MIPPGPAFRSFWIGGYEDPDHASGDDDFQIRRDYASLAQFEIRTVRENADWRRIDGLWKYDFSALDRRARAARDLGVQVVWTLLSERRPEGVGILSAAFVERFARYAGALAARVADADPDSIPVFAPINELSFVAWSLFWEAGVRRQDGTRAQFIEIKRQLVRAVIAACDAILARVPHARLLHTDPLEHVVAPPDRLTLACEAARRTEQQFQAWDLIAGRDGNDLGGDPRYLDIVGANYYAENQWELGSGKRLAWQIDDMRRLPLSSLLKTVHARYRRPIAISETGHTGVRRGAWIREIATEVNDALRIGVQVEGICLHPLMDQRDGRNPGKWVSRGLWDADLQLSPSYAASLRAAQKIIARATRATRPVAPSHRLGLASASQ